MKIEFAQMFLYDDGATRVKHFFDIFRVRGDGKMLETVMIVVPIFDNLTGAIAMGLGHDVGEAFFDVHTRPLVFVILAVGADKTEVY